MERLPHPDIYKKAIITNSLVNEGFDLSQLQLRGGLSYQNYETFLSKMFNRYQIVQEFQNNMDEERLAQLQESSKVCQEIKPVTGIKKALVLLVQFNDKKGQTDPDEFRRLLFDGSTKSMRNYYLEASWKQLDIQGKVSEWITLDKDYSHYVDLDNMNKGTLQWKMPKAQNLVREALLKVEDEFNFSDFDSNNQGSIDILIVIFAGEGANRTGNYNQITPHRNKFNEPLQLKDTSIENYILINELPSYDLGGFCHEVAHTLGLPDLYFPDFSSTIVGTWCLMGHGDYADDGKTPSHLSAWCKMRLGWFEPEIIKGEPSEYKIPAVIRPEKKIYKLEVKNRDGKEYFLVENRQQLGFDQFIPAGGLLIWHIDENRCLKRFPNFDLKNLFLTLVQADGKDELEQRIFRSQSPSEIKITREDFLGDCGDVFPGEEKNKVFDFKSRPNSKSYCGENSGVIIESISEPGNVMTAVMGIKISSVTGNHYNDGYRAGYRDGFNLRQK